MKEHIVCIDTETTGLDKTKDRIIQIALIKFSTKTREIIDQKSWYIIPSGEWTINPGAEEIHHISRETILQEGVSLQSIKNDIISFCKGCDFLTYNGNSFDWNFIQREFEREDSSIDFMKEFSDSVLYDSFQIEKTHNSHKLSDVYKRLTGKDMEDAHDALGDVKATVEVFLKQLDIYDDIDDISQETSNQTTLSPEGFLTRNDEGVLVFKSGKYKDYPVVDVCKKDISYIYYLNSANILTNPSKRNIVEAWKEYNKH